MCGIVGLFAKTRSVEDSLGKLLSDMLIVMSDRGPDSAGVALYKKSNGNKIKVTLQSEEPSEDFPKLNSYLSKKKNLKILKLTHAPRFAARTRAHTRVTLETMGKEEYLSV